MKFALPLRFSPQLQSLLDEQGGASHVATQLGVNKSTIYRWLEGKSLPQTPEIFAALAQILKCDPILFFEWESPQLRNVLNNFVQQRYHIVPGILQSFRPGLKLFSEWFSHPDWPPPAYAESCGFSWHLHQVLHRPQQTGRRNLFETFCLTRSTPHQAFYFAWREVCELPDKRAWTPFGLVLTQPLAWDGHALNIQQRTTLFHGRGQFEDTFANTDFTHILIETRFGAEPADFLIASLHPFELVTGPPETSWVKEFSPLRFL